MPISSFYGLQTSLRGLLAHQRSLDTTGHNIANAATQGYSRQEATLAATPALQIPAGGVTSGAGAHLGTGVEVSSYRRVRDQFLDLQYRGQNTNLGDWQARAQTLDQAQAALAEPGDDGVNAQIGKFWDAWSNLAKAPSDAAAKTALVEQADSLTDSLSTVRAQMSTVRDQAYGQYADLSRPASGSDPGGKIAQIASELGSLNDTISKFASAGDPPNDLMDRRDLLLDQLSQYGQISVENLASGSTKVSFVDAASPGTTYPIVDDKLSVWAGPPAGDAWSPGGQLGGLLAVSKPGGTIDGYLSSLDSFATSLADAVNGAYGGTFFTSGTPAAAQLQVAAPLQLSPSSIVAGTSGSGSNDLALKVSQLRGSATIDQAYTAFVAQVGAQVAEADRQSTNAQVLTNAVEDRRQSVAGVSMDEEMSNLVRFQRSYQASARAMSTMDDVLDVLVNRTGRVGL